MEESIRRKLSITLCLGTPYFQLREAIMPITGRSRHTELQKKYDEPENPSGKDGQCKMRGTSPSCPGSGGVENSIYQRTDSARCKGIGRWGKFKG